MRRRGQTLIEVLVGGGLTSLVLILAFSTLSFCMRYWRIDQLRGALATQAMSLEERVTRELSLCPRASLTFDERQFTFLTPGCATDPITGLPVWDHYVAYRFNPASREVVRFEPQATGFPSTRVAPIEQAEGSASRRRVASSVDSFSLTVDERGVATLAIVMSENDVRLSRRTTVVLQEAQP